MVNQPISFSGVYYLESQNLNMNPIAIRPEITPPDYVAWEDTSNGRILHFSKILVDNQEIETQPDKLPKTIEIISENNETYKLVKLTTALFNEKLKWRVAGGESLNFQSDQELQNYYLKADFYTAG